jgi:hypothetical protein
MLYAFLIFLSLSVAAIPLGPPAIGQTPRLPSLLPPDLPALPEQLLKSFPLPLPKSKVFGRFIMGADYASSSGPFLGKSSHKRQDPLFGALGSTLRANDVKEELPPKLSSESTPT